MGTLPGAALVVMLCAGASAAAPPGEPLSRREFQRLLLSELGAKASASTPGKEFSAYLREAGDLRRPLTFKASLAVGGAAYLQGLRVGSTVGAWILGVSIPSGMALRQTLQSGNGQLARLVLAMRDQTLSADFAIGLRRGGVTDRTFGLNYRLRY